MNWNEIDNFLAADIFLAFLAIALTASGVFFTAAAISGGETTRFRAGENNSEAEKSGAATQNRATAARQFLWVAVVALTGFVNCGLFDGVWEAGALSEYQSQPLVLQAHSALSLYENQLEAATSGFLIFLCVSLTFKAIWISGLINQNGNAQPD